MCPFVCMSVCVLSGTISKFWAVPLSSKSVYSLKCDLGSNRSVKFSKFYLLYPTRVLHHKINTECSQQNIPHHFDETLTQQRGPFVSLGRHGRLLNLLHDGSGAGLRPLSDHVVPRRGPEMKYTEIVKSFPDVQFEQRDGGRCCSEQHAYLSMGKGVGLCPSSRTEPM